MPNASARRPYIGISGYDYKPWRGAFYAAGLPARRWLEFASRQFDNFSDEFFALLREHRCAFVVADTAGKFPYAEEITADFVYIRLHGSQQLYVSGYTDDELDAWAAKIARWRGSGRRRRDVYVYFDNDAKVHAPFDALRLRARLTNASTE